MRPCCISGSEFELSENSTDCHESEPTREEIMSADVLDLEVADHEQEVDQPEVVETESLPPVICYRDPADVRTIKRQSRLLLLALFVTATAVVGVVYKSIQRP